jgi:hypothetical protein
MSNNPINKPQIPANLNATQDVKPVNEVKTATNSFTEQLRNVPDKIVDEVSQEATGKKLTREEQLAFLQNLPDDLMVEFAQRVKSHIEDEQQVKKTKKLEYVTDFSTLREDSIFDLNVPIQAIDHQIPEYLNIKLIDPNFAPRWIQTSTKRLGQARSQGWVYITKEDLAEKLHVEIEADSSGHYVYIDTVAMKIPKQKLFSQLRANYMRAIALTQQSKLHESMRRTIEAEIERSVDEKTGLPLRENYLKYKESGAMSTYSPLSL